MMKPKFEGRSGREGGGDGGGMRDGQRVGGLVWLSSDGWLTMRRRGATSGQVWWLSGLGVGGESILVAADRFIFLF